MGWVSRVEKEKRNKVKGKKKWTDKTDREKGGGVRGKAEGEEGRKGGSDIQQTGRKKGNIEGQPLVSSRKQVPGRRDAAGT